MILSSDKLSGLGKPVVQLKLDTATGNDSSIQENIVEMDLTELTALLKSLKSAQSVSNFEAEFKWLVAFLIVAFLVFFLQAAQVK